LAEPVPAGTTSDFRPIPLQLYAGYLPVIEGQAAGLPEPQHFVLDTGTAPSILNVRLARKLGLLTSPSRVNGLGGLSGSEATVIPDIAVGPIHASNLHVQVRDLSRLERDLGVPIGAVIGLDVLGQTSFRIDYEKREVIFGDAFARHGIEVPYDRRSGLAIVSTTIPGRKGVRLLLDTGSDRLVFLGGNLDEVQQQALRQPIPTGASELDSKMGVRPVPLREMTLGDSQFHPKAYLVPQTKDPAFDGVLGVRALGLRAIAYDSTRERIYLER
jgi:hypothetical protein